MTFPTVSHRRCYIFTILLLVAGGILKEFWSGSNTLHLLDTVSSISSIRRQPSSTNEGAVLYIEARVDRAGAVIANMLSAHAFAFAEGATYGGACEITPTDLGFTRPGQWRRFNDAMKRYRADQKKLLDGIGLQDILPFACPSNSTHDREVLLKQEWMYVRRPDEYLWTPEWLNLVRSVVDYPSERTSIKKTVAVHVRRGDASPCKNGERYSTNSYYLAVLDRYLAEFEADYEISIYSERVSSEPFDDFVRRNYTLRLDTDIVEVWRAFMTADILIMSRSSFSYTPALLNRHGLIVYTPYLRKPMSEWTVVDEGLIEFHDEELERLAAVGNCSGEIIRSPTRKLS